MGDPRQEPTPAFIEALRARFPTEREIDRVLTRKMRQRAGAPHVPVTLDQIVGCIEKLLAAKLDGPFAVRDPRWMTGGSSKLQIAFDLDRGGDVIPLVLRMSPAESIVTLRPIAQLG